MADQLMPPSTEWVSLVPGSTTITWRRAGDVRVLLAAGYALLLQVSHPTVGAGVSEHSRFRTDPWGRLLRTLDYSCTMVYAGPGRAGEMGRRIREFHKQIRGVRPDGIPYNALEPEAYAWVHATLAAGIVQAHECFGFHLAEADREQLWGEWRTLGRLLGIRPRDLPPTWREFRVYYQHTVEETLVRTVAVEEVLEALAHPMPPELSRVYRPLWSISSRQLGHLVALATAGLLPEILRERFGIPWGRRRDLELHALGAALRAATPVMPDYLLNTGPGYLDWRSEQLARGEVASARLA
ncbi:MAG TPA: oxygenase MpaB family protein [Solirubrobacteraceae bacterium]|nr:oxygenase MpaB family protein [Solirubrobacteraceae bacterium]